jgi:hypothetical protein
MTFITSIRTIGNSFLAIQTIAKVLSKSVSSKTARFAGLNRH